MENIFRKHKSNHTFLPLHQGRNVSTLSFNSPQVKNRFSYLQTADSFYLKQSTQKLSQPGTVLSDIKNCSQFTTNHRNSKFQQNKNKIVPNQCESLIQSQISTKNVNSFKKQKIIEVKNKKYYFNSPSNHKFENNYFKEDSKINHIISKNDANKTSMIYYEDKNSSKEQNHMFNSPISELRQLRQNQSQKKPVHITNINYFICPKKHESIEPMIESKIGSPQKIEQNCYPNNFFNQINKSSNLEKIYEHKLQSNKSRINSNFPNQSEQQNIEANYFITSTQKSQFKAHNIRCQEQHAYKILIQEYEKQNCTLQNKNRELEKMIREKVGKQKQMLEKLNKIMKQMEQYKENQIIRLHHDQQLSIRKAFQNQQKSLQTCLLNNSCSQEKSRDLRNLHNFQQPISRQFELQKYQKSKFKDLEFKGSQDKKRRQESKQKSALIIDSILEYSLIDQSSFNPSKANSNSYNIDSMNNISTERCNGGKSKCDKNKEIKQQNLNNLMDLSISGFDSRLVPKLTNKQKLAELEELFEMELQKSLNLPNKNIIFHSDCYSDNNILLSNHCELKRNQSKIKLKQLSKQMKQLRSALQREQKQKNKQNQENYLTDHKYQQN